MPSAAAAVAAAMVGVVNVVRGGTLPRMPVVEEGVMYWLVDKGCRWGMGFESPVGGVWGTEG